MVNRESIDSAGLLELAAQAKPASIRSVLSDHGFEQRKPNPSLFDVADIFVSPDGRRLIVPLSRKAPDFDRCILRIAETLAMPPLGIADLLTVFAMPRSGIVKARLRDPSTHLGVAPLSLVVETIQGLLEMLRFSAASVASESKPAFFTNVPENAKVFADACQLGQTERGSFAIKVYCPLNPLNLAPDIVEDAPIGERALQAYRENATYLIKGSDQSPIPSTLTKNFVDAFIKLKPATEFGTVDLDVVTDAIKPEKSRLTADSSVFQRAYIVGLGFDREEKAQPETLTGFVTDLHSDPPGTKELNRVVGIRVKYGGGHRTVRVSLVGTDYKKAVEWHGAEREVRLRCVLNKKSNQWTIDRLLEFRPIDGVDPLAIK